MRFCSWTRFVFALGFAWFSTAITHADATSNSRLSAIACRAAVGIGSDVLIAGFIMGGTGSHQVIVRASGPAIQGVSGTLSQPQLVLYRVGDTTPVGLNTGWSSGDAATTAALQAAFTQVGLSPFKVGSADCAFIVTMNAGEAYTAVIDGVSGATGVAVVEVYELGTGGGRLTALSARAQVGTGANILIPGLIVTGSDPKQVLVRASAPSGVGGDLMQPQLALYNAAGVKIADNTGWSTASNAANIALATAACGLMPFTPGSANSAILLTLPPGGYTAQVSGVGGSTGVALVEVYEVPQ